LIRNEALKPFLSFDSHNHNERYQWASTISNAVYTMIKCSKN